MGKNSRRKKRESLPFGTLVSVGPQPGIEQVLISNISYTPAYYNENCDMDINNLEKEVASDKFNWININSLYDVDLLRKVGAHFGLHNLLLEDILQTEHIPKFEEFLADDKGTRNHLFMTLKMISVNEDGNIDFEQVALVLGKNYVISFQEEPGDFFDTVRRRLLEPSAQVRNKSSDYLFFRLMDVVVDNYFNVLELLGDQLEDLEAKTLHENEESNLREILKVKKNLIYLRKSVFPLREALSKLNKTESELIQDNNVKYLSDIYDHTIHVIQSIETYRDLVSSLMDLHLSSISYRMNVVMKVLTIISTIFIPLTFLAGVYGMNFHYFPELDFPYAYPLFWLVCVIITVGMLIFFRRKKWL
jgi:magnesium transporter